MPSSALVIPGDGRSPVLIHVPHASRVIPPEVRADLLVTDVELAVELDESTDTATDAIAAAAVRPTRWRPATVVNRFARLVVDPERSPTPPSRPMRSGGARFTPAPAMVRRCAASPTRAPSSYSTAISVPTPRRSPRPSRIVCARAGAR